jgi:hypothetical protein
MNKSLIIALFVIVFFNSCSKDEETTTTTPQTTIQKLQHKWNLVSINDIQYLGSSTTQIDTIISYGLPGDYIDFRTDNFAYVRIAGDYDTLSYSFLNDTKILFSGDTLTINQLTATNLKLIYYGRETNPVNNYDNVITLNR